MISQKARYAFKAVIALARVGETSGLQIRELSQIESIPRKFLEQILLQLKAGGLIISRRGRDGGYRILKSPHEITFGQVLRLVDGPIAPLPCLSRTAYQRCEDCRDEAACGVRRGFSTAYDAMISTLERTTIADVLTDGGGALQ